MYLNAVIIAVLLVLGILFPPSAWPVYLLALIVFSVVIGSGVRFVGRMWIRLDRDRVYVDDMQWGRRQMDRSQVTQIVMGGRVWRVEAKGGSILRLRTEWSDNELDLLAQELKVPLIRET